jgi:hypothetical protein
MLKKTKLNKKLLEVKLLEVKKWLSQARSDLEPRYLKGNTGEFMLLVAVEQLIIYLESKDEN